jgi:hypothetical protein
MSSLFLISLTLSRKTGVGVSLILSHSRVANTVANSPGAPRLAIAKSEFLAPFSNISRVARASCSFAAFSAATASGNSPWRTPGNPSPACVARRSYNDELPRRVLRLLANLSAVWVFRSAALQPSRLGSSIDDAATGFDRCRARRTQRATLLQPGTSASANRIQF